MWSDVKIEKGVPAPRYRGRYKYPWEVLEVGDSFLVGEGLYGTVMAGAQYQGKKLGKRFVVRKVEDGVRVWRVE